MPCIPIRNKGFILLCGLLLLAQISLAQWTPEGQRRPRVGLVLSGGGAKGLAHIGALKVIEEAGVEIDYIGGSSMGAIVGALYASGYSAHELDSIFNQMNLADLIQDEAPRSARSFYEKENSERYVLSLPFDGFRVSFPKAFSRGQQVYNLLVRLLYHVRDVDDFSQLPIPFLCTATDVERGEVVLLDKGYLPEAITASGTFPSLFEPMEIDGKLLIDGGVVNNYPIDEIWSKGMDYVIGVDVQHGLLIRDSLATATDILLQINNYRTVRDMEAKRPKTTVYIKPDIDEFSVIDFEQGSRILKLGEAAARRQLPALKSLARSQRRQSSVGIRKGVDTLVIASLNVEGNNQFTRGYLKGKMRFTPGDTITFDQFTEGLGNLSATDNFQGIRYTLKSSKDNPGDSLVLKLSEDPTRWFIKMAAHYDALFNSSALINLTRKNLLARDDRASFDLILGDFVRYRLQYYLDKGSYWSFGFNSELNDFTEPVRTSVLQQNFSAPLDPGLQEFTITAVDLSNQLYFQTVSREELALRLGLQHQFLNLSTNTFVSDIPNDPDDPELGETRQTVFDNSHYFGPYGSLTLDTYDDRYFPTRGVFFDGNFELYLFSSDFNDNFSEFSIAQARLGFAFEPIRDLAVTLEVEGGFKLGISSVTSFDFAVGGYGNERLLNIIPFYGMNHFSVLGNSFLKNSARIDWSFAENNHLLGVFNMANVEDDLFRSGRWWSGPQFTGYGLGYGLESFLGPVEVYYTWSPEMREGQLLFSVGYWF